MEEQTDNKLFFRACIRGDLTDAAFAHNKIKAGMPVEDCFGTQEICHNIFVKVCAGGHIDMARWMHSQGWIDIHNSCERAFRKACYHGRLSVAQWLYLLSKTDAEQRTININILNSMAFRIACQRGFLDVAKFLYSLDEFDHDADVLPNTILDYFYIGASKKLDQWLLKKGALDYKYQSYLLQAGLDQQNKFIDRVLGYDANNYVYIPAALQPLNIQNRRFMKTKSANKN